MATPADVAAFRSTQRDLVAVVLAELVRWWRELIASLTGDVPVAEMESFTADLVATYGDAAALAAADWYDDLRESAGVPGRFRAAMADPAPREQAAAVARWAAGPLFRAEPDPQQALKHLSGGVERLVLQPARATIAVSVGQDPAHATWARVPGSASPCAFCRMLASRGAVYGSSKSAGGFTEADKYHTECWCVPTPVWPGQREPYDPDVFLQQYNDASAEAGGDPKAILAQMRKDLGIN